MNFDKFFYENGIEYFRFLDYKYARETKPYLNEKSSLNPKSVILYLLPYYTGEGENLSRYAVSRDYHLAIQKINEKLVTFLKDLYPCNNFKGYGDHSPIDERHAALITGMGVLGDNGLLINEKYGSYVFIGDVVCDLDASLLPTTFPKEIRRCSSCGKCKAACPTGALSQNGGLCLSAITQKKGTLTDSEASLIKKYNTAWGCDICQSVCPYNKDPKITPVEFFHDDKINSLTTEKILSMTDSEFSSRAFAWRGRDVLLRNLKILEK